MAGIHLLKIYLVSSFIGASSFVHSLPMLLEAPQNTTVSEGESAEFTCGVRHIVEETKQDEIFWFIHHKKTDKFKNIVGPKPPGYETIADGSLLLSVISYINNTDDYFYKLIISNTTVETGELRVSCISYDGLSRTQLSVWAYLTVLPVTKASLVVVTTPLISTVHTNITANGTVSVAALGSGIGVVVLLIFIFLITIIMCCRKRRLRSEKQAPKFSSYTNHTGTRPTITIISNMELNDRFSNEPIENDVLGLDVVPSKEPSVISTSEVETKSVKSQINSPEHAAETHAEEVYYAAPAIEITLRETNAFDNDVTLEDNSDHNNSVKLTQDSKSENKDPLTQNQKSDNKDPTLDREKPVYAAPLQHGQTAKARTSVASMYANMNEVPVQVAKVIIGHGNGQFEDDKIVYYSQVPI